MRCGSCIAIRINGVFCHEQGCPEKGRYKRCLECGNQFRFVSPFVSVCDDCCRAYYEDFDGEIKSDH